MSRPGSAPGHRLALPWVEHPGRQANRTNKIVASQQLVYRAFSLASRVALTWAKVGKGERQGVAKAKGHRRLEHNEEHLKTEGYRK